jgi:insertion element IS1 protein InsB
VHEVCSECGAQQLKKNGHIPNGKQNHRCKTCGRQFVLPAEKRGIAEDQRTLVECLAREKISLCGSCRAVGVSIRQLMDFMVGRCNAAPEHLPVHLAGSSATVMMQRLEAEAEEMGSFVEKKADKQRLWIAMETKTRQVIAFHGGDRSRDSAKQLWANLPAAYREQVMFYTDHYEAYKGVIPAAQHNTALTKKAWKTNHIERCNNTLRRRVARIMPDTLAFSKTLAKSIGAIKYFVCHYNLTRARALPV